jgi:hypothetical protein
MISEQDIRDWHHLKPAKLYEVKPKTYIKYVNTILFFDHLDGAYSYCLTLDNEVVHLSLSAPVTPLEQPE